MSVNIRSINNHLLADEKAREQISQLSKDVYDSINESTNALLNDVSVKKLSTGCPIVIEDPVANVAFASVKQKFTPKQEGSGDPYPAGGGRNLLPDIKYPDTSFNGITFTNHGDGSYSLNGSASAYTQFVDTDAFTLPAGSYVLSVPNTDVDTYAQIRSVDGTTVFAHSSKGEFTLAADTEVKYRHIVNASKTVNAVRFYPMIRLASDPDATYAPYSNIRPIVPYTGLEMTRAGKNLLDISKSTVTNGKFGEDGVFSANDKDTASRLDFKLQFYRDSKIADTKYIFGATVNKRHTFNAVIPDGCTRIRFANNGSTAEFTISIPNFLDAGTTICYSFDVLDATVGACKLSNFQLELGSTATPYEPFMAFDTYTDTLETPMYGGERDWVNGEMVDEWGTYTLNGTENIWTAGTNGPGYQFQLNLSNVLANKSVNTMPMLKCSHYATNTPNNLYSRIQGITIGTNATISIYDKVRATYTVSEYKAYLAAQYSAGTPVQIAYKRKVPTITQRTPQRISTIPGTNTIFGDGEFEIEWFKSPKKIAEERENLLLESFTDPIEAEGNLLVIKPVGGLPFDSVVTKFTPKQEGSGNPYPAGGGNQLCNITDYKSFTSSGITLTSSNGVVTLSGTATGTLTFGDGLLPVGTTGTFFISGSDGDVLVYARVTSSDGTNKWYSNQSFTLDGSETRVVIYIQVNPGKTVNTTVYPMLNAGTSALPWEPYENIRPILPYTKLSATRVGKNLLPNTATTTTTNGITYTINDDGTIVANGTATTDAYLFVNRSLYLDANTYILNGCYEGGRGTTYNLYVYVPSENLWHRNFGNEDTVFTLKANCEIQVIIRIATGVSMNNAIFRPMIRHASVTDPSYEPYTADTYTDTFDKPMYGGKMNWSTGELTVTHAMYTITGAESKFDWSINNAGLKRAIIPVPQTLKPTSDANSVDYCSHAPSGSTQGMTAGASINAQYMYIVLPTVQPQTKEEALAWFAAQYAAGTPVQFAYELAAPYTIWCTAHDIPALIGVNTLYGDGTIAVKGRQSKTIDLEERIAALEAAVLLS